MKNTQDKYHCNSRPHLTCCAWNKKKTPRENTVVNKMNRMKDEKKKKIAYTPVFLYVLESRLGNRLLLSLCDDINLFEK